MWVASRPCCWAELSIILCVCVCVCVCVVDARAKPISMSEPASPNLVTLNWCNRNAIQTPPSPLSPPLPLSPSPPLARSPTCFCYLLLHCGFSSSPPGHTLSHSIVSNPPAEKSSLSLNQNHCLWVLSNLCLCFSLLPATKTFLLLEMVSCLRDSTSPCKSLLLTKNRVCLDLSYLIFFFFTIFLLSILLSRGHLLVAFLEYDYYWSPHIQKAHSKGVQTCSQDKWAVWEKHEASVHWWSFQPRRKW